MSLQDRLERRRRMAQAVRSGQDIGKVARRFGVSVATARLACREFGVSVPDGRVKKANAPKPKPEPKVRVQQSTFHILADLINTSASLASIARRHHVSRQRVHQIQIKARAAGIPLHTRTEARSRRRAGS